MLPRPNCFRVYLPRLGRSGDSHVVGPLREMVSTLENKEEAAGGGGAQKGKRSEGCLVLAQKVGPESPRSLPARRPRRSTPGQARL